MINVSIVLYHTPAKEVRHIVELLRQNKNVGEIWLIDNSEIQTEAFMFMKATYIFNNRNIGYGAAHNIAIKKSINTAARYHLVINSDIDFNPTILDELIAYMDNNTDVAHCMPLIKYPDGTIQYLAKLLPTPTDLISRRFFPKFISNKRNKKFELQAIDLSHPTNVPYLSGCFMFLRTDCLKQVGLFDERYFMYPEDIDLTRRLHKHYKTVFYPMIDVTHNHNRASYHNGKMLFIHIWNMIKYFNKWGWIFDKERNEFNKATIKQITSNRQ